jgi:hypothetical protein
MKGGEGNREEKSFEAVARRRAEGRNRRDVSVEEGSSNGACIHRAASPSTSGSHQRPGRWDESTNLANDRHWGESRQVTVQTKAVAIAGLGSSVFPFLPSVWRAVGL